MKKILITIFVFLLSYPGISFGDDFTGNSLIQLCAGGDKEGKAFCNGYFAGVTNAYDEDFLKHSDICLPSGIAAEQIQKLYLKWSVNSQKRQLAAIASILAFYDDSFPCKTLSKK